MTTAVLKNTLLLLTDRAFNESVYGFESFISLVRSLDDFVSVEGTRAPFIVKLIAPPSTKPGLGGDVNESPRVSSTDSNLDVENLHVREDLWRAALDYTTQGGYWWVDGKALRAEPESPPSDATRIPAITRDSLNEARRRFGDQFLTPEETTRWIDDDRGAIKALPSRRAEWADELRRLVVNHLTEWFERSPGLDAPVDLFTASPTSRRPSHTLIVAEPPPSVTNDNSLLALVLDVVRSMTNSELEALQLPASAVSRAHLR